MQSPIVRLLHFCLIRESWDVFAWYIRKKKILDSLSHIVVPWLGASLAQRKEAPMAQRKRSIYERALAQAEKTIALRRQIGAQIGARLLSVKGIERLSADAVVGAVQHLCSRIDDEARKGVSQAEIEAKHLAKYSAIGRKIRAPRSPAGKAIKPHSDVLATPPAAQKAVNPAPARPQPGPLRPAAGPASGHPAPARPAMAQPGAHHAPQPAAGPALAPGHHAPVQPTPAPTSQPLPRSATVLQAPPPAKQP